jgi:hypothetical protein
MSLAKKKLVTIIVPETIETAVVEALAKITHGLSLVPARGRGAHGERPNVWHPANVQIETVVASEAVERVLAALERFRPTTPVVAWITDVEAWPADKFI